ncbi:type II secretion system protein [Synechocystis salina LEGE 06155]|nr:type II secretion system protein [Synechocystis salina LEGE 06155]
MYSAKVNGRYCLELLRCSLTSPTGFTLLEVLIVVIITSILAAIAIPNLVAQVDKARYSEAKTQMSCMAKELTAYRYEHGTFPPDVNRNIKPAGIDCFYTRQSGQVPFDSQYDYDRHGSLCYAHISFFGKDGARNAPTAGSVAYPNPGLYDHSETDPNSDDLVYSLGLNPGGFGC